MVQSLYLGLGVVADAIDSYREFDSCTFLDKWDEGLRSYVENPALLQAHIRDGQAIIRQNYRRHIANPSIAMPWINVSIRAASPITGSVARPQPAWTSPAQTSARYRQVMFRSHRCNWI